MKSEDSTHHAVVPEDIPEGLLEELDRRKAACQRDPDSLVPWESIKLRLGISSGMERLHDESELGGESD